MSKKKNDLKDREELLSSEPISNISEVDETLTEEEEVALFDYPGEVEVSNSEVELKKKEIVILLKNGEDDLNAKNFGKAKDIAMQILNLIPEKFQDLLSDDEFFECANFIMRAMFYNDLYHDAIKMANTIKVLFPHNCGDAYFTLGTIFAKQNRFLEAIIMYSVADHFAFLKMNRYYSGQMSSNNIITLANSLGIRLNFDLNNPDNTTTTEKNSP